MKHTLTSKAAELMRKNGKHRRWRRAFSGMAAVVVFITTYMLILPAITMENQAICGMAEHTHTDACYEMQLVCTQEETPEGADVHVHGPECYEQQQVLTCTQQEGEGHAHSDACYGYACGQEESAGHTHTDACYTEVTHRELTCTEPESAGHSHGEGCYDADGNLVCTEAESTGHTHGDSCYTETVTRELTCGQEESSGHTHTDACIGLICGQEESAGHTHTDACYTTEDVLVCTEPTGHTHGDSCYEKVLVCDVPEHTHTEECYAPVEIPEEETPTTAFPEEIPEGYVEYTFDNEAGLTVTAYAPEGAFGQDVQLFAEVLPEDSEEYAQAKENLDKAENAPEYTGMAAMDIRFVDAAAEDPAQAEEIEPDAEMGQVFVKIDAQALIPEDVDESTLAVQHHAKVSDGGIFGTGILEHTDVVVETVADISEETGDITAVPDETALPETLPALADEPEMAEAATLEEPAAETEEPQPVAMNVEAEFAVNSFSKFTITWVGDKKTVTVYYVNENGAEIQGPQTLPVKDVPLNTWIDLKEEYGAEIEGYSYIKATVNTGTQVTHIKVKEDIGRYWWGGTYKVYNAYYKNGEDSAEWPFNSEVRLVYRPTNLSLVQGEDTADDITINLFDYNASEINLGRALQFSIGEGSGSINTGTGSSDPKTGIVQNQLSNGYPVLNNNESLSYLFNNSYVHGKTSYLGLNYLFQKDENGYYYYDSAQNFATLVTPNYSNGSVTTQNNDNIDWSNLRFYLYNQQGRYIHTGSAEQNVLFLPFNGFRNTTNQANTNIVNYHFGMTISTKFLMPKDGQVDGRDMVFEFRGDDDVWVFVDNTLALDLGGMHSASSGSINFNTGDIIVNGVVTGNLWTMLEVDRWENFSEHDLKFFYLERGAYASNCKIAFNLVTIPTGTLTVSKDVDATESYLETHKTDKYRMQLLVNGEVQKGKSYTILGDDTGRTYATDTTTGAFDILDGQTAVFADIEEKANYQVKELGVVKESGEFVALSAANFSGVKFNDSSATINSGGAASPIYTEFSSESGGNVVVRNTPVVGGEDRQFITVQKTIYADDLTLTAEQLKSELTNYSIQVYKGTVNEENLLTTLYGSYANVSGSNGSYTLVWEVPAEDVTTNTEFVLVESGHENLLTEQNYSWSSGSGFGNVVQVTPSSMTVNDGAVVVPQCNFNFKEIGNADFIVAHLTGNGHQDPGDGYDYLVYSEYPLSLGERQKIVAWAASNANSAGGFNGITMENTAFYSQETNPDGFTFRGYTIQYPVEGTKVQEMVDANNKLVVADKPIDPTGKYIYFSLASQWSKFVYGTYTVTEGDMDIETSNTYTPSAGDLGIAKIVTRTDSQTPSGENFQFNIKMTASNDTAVTGTYSYELYSGTYDAAQKTWSWTIVNPGDGAAENKITFNENGITNVTGQVVPGDSAANCIELNHAQKIVIKGLPSGATAQITETETSRAGYSPAWSGEVATPTPGATTTTWPISANDPVEVTCTNTTGAVLPSTGGMGTTPFLALGTLLTLGAGMLLVQRRRKEGSDAV